MWTFDPDLLTARDGSRYLYFGSYYGGIYVTELSSDGLRAVGKPTQVAINDRYEGGYVIQRNGYYYLRIAEYEDLVGYHLEQAYRYRQSLQLEEDHSNTLAKRRPLGCRRRVAGRPDVGMWVRRSIC